MGLWASRIGSGFAIGVAIAGDLVLVLTLLVALAALVLKMLGVMGIVIGIASVTVINIVSVSGVVDVAVYVGVDVLLLVSLLL